MVFDLNGNVVGTHHGAHLYTLGERMRADTPPSDHRNPQYVVAKDLQKNTITIATQPLTVSAQVLSLDSVIWRGESGRTKCEAQFRYRQSPFQVTVEKLADGYAKLRVDSAGVDMPSSGQSCVLYEGARCIGGGIIGA
jgi:tRNA-specific 2-thiouridylase